MVLVAISTLPGMPALPTLLIALLAAASYFYGRRALKRKAQKTEHAVEEKDQDPYQVYDVEALDVELGAALAGACRRDAGSIG